VTEVTAPMILMAIAVLLALFVIIFNLIKDRCIFWLVLHTAGLIFSVGILLCMIYYPEVLR
jgi:hypothetical protein